MFDEWGKGAKYWDKAYNPMVGCRKCSEGCANCYAESLAMRFPELQDGNGGFMPHRPKKDKNPPQNGVVFVGNMTDIFGEWNDNLVIYNWLYSLSKEAINLVLTKRGGQLLDFMQWNALNDYPLIEDNENIWFGVTAENQERLEERLPALYHINGKRWISAEPLIGWLDFGQAIWKCRREKLLEEKIAIDWVVVGAESGANRRPCKLEWVRNIVKQCQRANVPVFVKQLDIDGKLVKDINQFPEDLQIRQVPWGGCKMSDLKNCPFCESSNSIKHSSQYSNQVYYECNECGCSVAFYSEERDFWNTRPAEDAKDREIERLKAALKRIAYFRDLNPEMKATEFAVDVESELCNFYCKMGDIAKQALANAPDTGKMEEE